MEKEFFNIHHKFSQVAIDNAKIRCPAWGLEVDRTIRKCQGILGKLARDASLSAEKEITTTKEINVILTYKKINTEFRF